MRNSKRRPIDSNPSITWVNIRQNCLFVLWFPRITMPRTFDTNSICNPSSTRTTIITELLSWMTHQLTTQALWFAISWRETRNMKIKLYLSPTKSKWLQFPIFIWPSPNIANPIKSDTSLMVMTNSLEEKYLKYLMLFIKAKSQL